MILPDRQAAHDKEEEELRRAWRNTKIWKAIEKEINNAPISESAFVDKLGPIDHPRGSSGITLEKVWAYPAGAGDEWQTTVRFWVKVVCWNDDEDRNTRESPLIDIPISLVTNFSQKSFDEFRLKHLEKRNGWKLEAGKKALERLLREYPQIKHLVKMDLSVRKD